MQELAMVEWSDEALSGCGLNLVPKQIESVADGQEFAYESLSDKVSLGNLSSAGFLVCARRDMILSKMERHTETMEMLVSLKGDSVICLALPGAKPKPETIKAVRFPQGKALAMYPGIWHWIPYPLQDEPSRCLVVFKERTGENDLELSELNESIRLVL